MPKFDKPSNLNTIWASEALSQNNVYPSVSYAEEGWLQVKPPYQYENALNFKHDQMLAHLNQLGIPEWDSTTEYQAGKSYVQGSNNVVYKCIQTHVNKNPATAGNETFWNVWEGNRQATTGARGTTQYATSNQAKTGTSNNVALTPFSLLDGFVGIADLSDKGYMKIPVNVSGVRREVIVQWNRQATGSSDTYAIPYPNRALNVQITDSGSKLAYGVTNITASGFNVLTDDVNETYSWIAIGY